MADIFIRNNSVRSVSDRAQRIAFWVSTGGIGLDALMFTLYALNDGLTLYLTMNALFYTIPLAFIGWSSYRNWHFQAVLDWSIAAIYFYMWMTTFVDAYMGHPSVLSYPILLFMPFFLILVTSSRSLVLYAIMQAVFVFSYGEYYLAEAFGFNPDYVDANMLAILLATLSSLTLLVLALVAYSRQKTDGRLLSLVQETERLAAQDPLTNLKNRRAFMEDVETFWASKTPFAVIFIDLDRFKPLNDEFGHAAGDHVLRTIAQRLQEAPETVSAARFGGDEFAVLIKDQFSELHLRARVEALHSRIVSQIDLSANVVAVQASVGYARTISDGFSVSELLHAADTAMLRSKADGGGVAKFDPQLDASRLAASAVEELFRHALNTGGIRPALQPIVDARTQLVLGYELLSRWPNSGMASDPTPPEFIPVAEKLGLLNELLWSTMHTALPFLRERHGFLAINVSPAQLASSSFLGDLKAITAQYDFELNRIEIEITEHVAFRNLVENVRVLEEARAMGCRIVLDDFGSGYSSLSLLEELPLDKIKLDKSLQATPNKRGVLEATIQLATGLRFDCCVEGIETQEAAISVAAQGCDQMQGYWFGHPELIVLDNPELKVAS
ncbi:MAG: EAL domain-containing protein [Henriciella sp.]